MFVPLPRIDNVLSTRRAEGWRAAARQLGRHAEGVVAAGLRSVQRPEVVWGRDVVIEGPLVLRGRGRVVVGDGVRFIGTRQRPNELTLLADDAVVHIGEGAVLKGASATVGASLDIGARAVVGGDVVDSEVPSFDPASRLTGAMASSRIVIGAGAWLGKGTQVLRGGMVGRSAVVHAGTVVRCPIPDGAIVAGQPAKVIGFVPGYAVIPEDDLDPSIA